MGVLLIAVVIGVCWAETVNVNPHKIVLNAKGQSDDVQANVHIVLPNFVRAEGTLSFNGIKVADSESASYCAIDDILFVNFDRTELQNNPDVQAMANTTVTATVVGTVTSLVDGEEVTREFGGTDNVQIVLPDEDQPRNRNSQP